MLGRFRRNIDGFDLELIGGRFRGRGIIGLGYEGERRKITYWGEVARYERDYSIITGGEKEIRPKLRLGLAFLHQDFGTTKSERLLSVFSDAPYREGWAHLGGRSYGLLTIQKEFTPLIKGDLNGLFNLHDRSTLWQPKVLFNTGDNSDIAFFAWLSTGSQPTIQPLPIGGALLQSRTEFGLFPSGIGVIARRFF